MSLTTHSKWYFGYEIDNTNSSFDFDEGMGEIQATLNIGSYTFSEIVTELERALNDALGGLVYTVTGNRVDRTITISSTSNFSILSTTGTRAGTGCYDVIGFTGLDWTGDDTYTGDPAGSEYKTQFILQDYTPSTDSYAANEGTVNISASGEVEVFKFGIKALMMCDLMYVTSLITGSRHIRDDAQGKQKLITFMQFLITKAPLEFMEDENDPNTFQKMLLESTAKDSKGIGYELKEMVNKHLPQFYETGKLTFRIIS